MRLLLDTHIALWLATAPSRLRDVELQLLSQSPRLILSAIVIWELRLKWNSLHRSGERKGPADPSDVLTSFLNVGSELLPLTPAHAAATLSPPLAHKDPFDELLLVQAQGEGLRLLTRDARLIGHPLAVHG